MTRGADDHFVILTDVADKNELERMLDQVNDKVKRGAKGNTAGIFSGICPVDADGTGDVISRAIDHARHALKRIEQPGYDVALTYVERKQEYDRQARTKGAIYEFDK